MNDENLVLKIDNLTKIYKDELSNENLTILNGLNFDVKSSSKNIIIGESGSGKSTLLNIIGSLDTATSGRIDFFAKDTQFCVTSLKEKELESYRSKYLGLIFQFHYLLKDFSALENVFLPAFIATGNKKQSMEKARQLLADVGLENRMNHVPAKLSGGERQRVAVARALINEPELILADEPTGNLDHDNAMNVSEILFSMVEKYKKTLILVTHDKEISKMGDNVYRIEGGKLV
ncbi:MAG: ABC transporter ATP-binding protein [Treponemataceae bacterium]|nr:ABC transporter ATP-binding protein [Treponemataceae bacterium]